MSIILIHFLLKSVINRNFLSLRVARVWNCLPANATNFKTIHAFKESLNKIDYYPPLKITYYNNYNNSTININNNNYICACAGICLLDRLVLSCCVYVHILFYLTFVAILVLYLF